MVTVPQDTAELRQRAWDAAAGVVDPELPVLTIADLGVLRDVAVMALCALVIRQIYRPEEDLVRWQGRVDDPAGGIYDLAPDVPPGWLPKWLRPASLRRPIPAAAPSEADAALSVASGTS